MQESIFLSALLTLAGITRVSVPTRVTSTLEGAATEPLCRGGMSMRARAVSQVVSNAVSPWTPARQAPLSVGFLSQEYWSGLPFSPPGDLHDPGIQPMSFAFLYH